MTRRPRSGRFAAPSRARLPLGTPYPRVIEHIVKLSNHPALKNRATLVCDATGAGQPVVDELRRANLGATLVAVTITGGGHANRSAHGWCVPLRAGYAPQDLPGAVLGSHSHQSVRAAT